MLMISYYIGSEYSIKPSSVRFDQEMVEFTRLQTEMEFIATKLSIDLIGQTDAIVINSTSGLCENGRHRVKACIELGIDIKCIQIDGTVSKALRLAIYNKEDMSGKDLSVAQRAIQAHKYIVLTGQTVSEGAEMFKSSIRNVGDANAIAGLGRTDILDKMSKDGEWTRPTGGNPVKSLRTIASELRIASENLQEVTPMTARIDYEAMVVTETGKNDFYRLRSLMQMSQHETNMVLVEMLNLKYVPIIEQETGKVTTIPKGDT